MTSWIHGTNRTVIGDFAFSSVSTAKACKQYRLHFMSIIKTAHKQYPIEASIGPANAGNFNRSSSLCPCLGWQKAEASYQHQGGHFPRGAIYLRKSKINRKLNNIHKYFIEVPRPSMIKMFFDPFNAVNTNDQYRQGILRLEERWKTNWATRAINNPWRHYHKLNTRAWNCSSPFHARVFRHNLSLTTWYEPSTFLFTT